MRVLMINSVCGTGSTGKIVVGLLRTVQEAGEDGRIFYGVGKAEDANSEDAVKFGNCVDYYFHNARSRLTDHAGFYSSAATRRMIAAIERYNPDLIHLHNLHGYYLNIELLFHYLAECGKPVVWTLHDCWPFTGHCTHFTRSGCEQWKNCCTQCSQLRQYPKCMFRGDVKHNYIRKRALFTALPSLTLITPSEWLADMVRQSFLGGYEVYPIPNGIDTEIFQPTPGSIRDSLGLEGKKIALGVASVWNERKGLQDFIALSHTLPEGWRLVLVGLSKKQRDLFPDNVVKLPRITSQSELAQLYSAADVFVNPSYEETMGLTTAEALACGTPAVVYDRTAVPELVDEKSGIVVPAGDLVSLRTAICSCSVSRADARARGDYYAQKRKNEMYLQLYRRLSGE